MNAHLGRKRARSDKKEFVAGHSGHPAILEVPHHTETQGRVGTHNLQLRHALNDVFTGVQWKRVLGQPNFLLSVPQFDLGKPKHASHRQSKAGGEFWQVSLARLPHFQLSLPAC